ncbi:MAG: fibronectin type III domain-containing protein [Candidatus Lokiarchaeota archaeon]|nr:fibronectin type III domain-containing protein [Candidatus Lokiarchaeota archaeon]
MNTKNNYFIILGMAFSICLSLCIFPLKTEIIDNNILKDTIESDLMPAAIPTPVHEYKFEETSGTTVYDSGSSSVNGMRFGATINQPGADGRGYYFDGDDYISFPLDSSFTFTNEITLSVWINPNGRGDYRDGGTILGKSFSSSSPWDVYGLYYFGNGNIYFYVSDSTGSDFAFYAETTTIVPLNEWTRITAVYTGFVENSSIYFNGTAQPLNNVEGVGGEMRDVTSSFHIGDNTYGYLGFNGSIDEVQIFDDAFTREDVLELTGYNGLSEPQDVVDIAGNERVILSWDPPEIGATSVTNYRIYRRIGYDGTPVVATIGNTTSYVDTGLTNNMYYCYQISAISGMMGEGPKSVQILSYPQVQPPDSPKNFQVIAGSEQVVLAWEAPDNNGGDPITGYIIYYRTASSITYFIDVDNVTTYTHLGLANGETYYYSIRASNLIGDSAATPEVSATPNFTVPGSPQNLQATAGNCKVILTWNAPFHNGGKQITDYKINRANSSGGEVFHASAGTELTYADTGLKNGQIYYYTIIAVNIIGESTPSNEVSATPNETVPEPPQNIWASVNNGRGTVVLGWEAPNDDGGSAILNYWIYRKNSFGLIIRLAIVNGDEFTYTDTITKDGQIYNYSVVAVNALGCSNYSDELSISIEITEVYSRFSVPGFETPLMICCIIITTILVTSKMRRHKKFR